VSRAIRPSGASVLASAAVCVVACLLATAFGAASYRPPVDRHLITQADVSSRPAGSPDRSVVEWFKAIQHRDQAGVYGLLTPAARRRVSARSVGVAARIVSGAVGKPDIVGVAVRGDRAAVRLLMLSYVPGGGAPASAYPFTVGLARLDGRWWIADASYLMNSARDIKALRRP
jgi:hypothetical protein